MPNSSKIVWMVSEVKGSSYMSSGLRWRLLRVACRNSCISSVFDNLWIVSFSELDISDSTAPRPSGLWKNVSTMGDVANSSLDFEILEAAPRTEDKETFSLPLLLLLSGGFSSSSSPAFLVVLDPKGSDEQT